MMSVPRKYIDELLVYGYLREGRHIEINIPEDIMNICLQWYHIKSYLFKAGKSCIISEDGSKVTYSEKDTLGVSSNSCYGSVSMPSISKREIEYKYKIKFLQPHRQFYLAIGIDDAQC